MERIIARRVAAEFRPLGEGSESRPNGTHPFEKGLSAVQETIIPVRVRASFLYLNSCICVVYE